MPEYPISYISTNTKTIATISAMFFVVKLGSDVVASWWNKIYFFKISASPSTHRETDSIFLAGQVIKFVGWMTFRFFKALAFDKREGGFCFGEIKLVKKITGISWLTFSPPLFHPFCLIFYYLILSLWHKLNHFIYCMIIES